MAHVQRIVQERRAYNQWVANQTLEDYALRFTARRARKSAFRIGNTALGAISFLACEAIGGSITLTFGFSNVAAAIMAVGVLSFLIGLPITYHAAKAGVDIDLLTRGAGFGYLGSTITSLIYASFTFVLFSIEASIMSIALQMVFGIPLAIAHIFSALVVIPIAAYGIRYISRMQLFTQPIWLILQLAPLAYIAFAGRDQVSGWTHFYGARGAADGSISLLMFGAAASVLMSLLPQIGEQVDYLRFLPVKTKENRWRWWTALIMTGPGWVVMGGAKLFAGSFLTFLALHHGIPADRAAQPAEVYHLAFLELFRSPAIALALTGLFVVTCQIKINVTNAYAGSIAWSNFFSRLTHSHPGRVVWLVFNVLLALLLMEVGIFRAIESILGLYANFAVGWIGAVTADLMINKPLGLSPPFIEFKRAHLYDINPVGVGAMLLSVLVSTCAFFGLFGPSVQSLSPFVGLLVAFAAAPLIAWATKGKYYIAREPGGLPAEEHEVRCTICENKFERNDMALCPAYGGPICSLCCTLEARCHDQCKPQSRIGDQFNRLMNDILPTRAAAFARTRLGQFAWIFGLFAAVIAGIIAVIYFQNASALSGIDRGLIGSTLLAVFFSLLIVSGIAAWLLVLANESRRVAERESERQTETLMQEIEAHERTDAALQKAKEAAEAANFAKSRYIVGLSHEIRSPLNSIFGYAQLLERERAMPTQNPIRVIRRSAEHLSDLVDGLLDISRIETGTLRLSQEKVCLPELLDQLADMFRLQAEAKGIGFVYECPAVLPQFVNADEKRLRQILINLLSNAVKYTEAGQVTFRMGYRNHVAEFQISDTGMGIRPEDMESIFEPFERGGIAPARAIPGTGLGLTITKLLTHIMGGEIVVDSTPGIGSTFTVRLLLFAALPSSEDGDAKRRICGYVGRTVRVMLADDDALHLDFARQILVPLGFAVFTAPDGPSAIALAEECTPDVALLDISMPGKSGWDVAAALREQHPQTKIMIVSANAHDFQSKGESGPLYDAFLVKPFGIQRLLSQLQSLLGLEWVYDVPSAVEDSESASSDLGDLPDGASRHIEELMRLGEIGYVRGIQQKLAQMEAESAAYGPLSAQLRGYLESFEFDAYMRSLKELAQ